MVIVTENSWPPAVSKDLGKAFLDMPPLPEYITVVGPFVRSDLQKGIRSLFIYQCEKARLADAYQLIANRMTNYHKLPGLSYTVHVWLESQEALRMVGL